MAYSRRFEIFRIERYRLFESRQVCHLLQNSYDPPVHPRIGGLYYFWGLEMTWLDDKAYPPPGSIVRSRCAVKLLTDVHRPQPTAGQQIAAGVGETFLFVDIDISNNITPYWILQSERGLVKWFDFWIHSGGWMNDWVVVSYGRKNDNG